MIAQGTTDGSDRDRPGVALSPFAHSALVLLCIALGFAAHTLGNPVTAALLFLFGVVLIAARAGLRHGLVAGVLASLAYNFLSAPALRLSFSGLDDLVPLLAFNISAVASAYLAGRLRDEARASNEASRRVASLLSFSGHLQPAVDLVTMMQAAQSANPALTKLEIGLDDGRVFTSSVTELMQSLESSEPHSPEHSTRTLSEQFDGGIVTCTAAEEHAADTSAYLAILAIVAERWVLTERLVDADVFRRSEAFKTSLLSSMSHDLRTPLSVISASAGSLLRYGHQLPEEHKRDLLESIEQQANRLSQFTSKLLSLGRIEGGIAASAMPEVDALEVLGAALVNIRQVAPARVIRKSLDLEVAPVRADASLLEQVIYNVLENATVHTPEESPIFVSAYIEHSNLVIGIEDRGPGVSESDKEQVFERFGQGGAAAANSRGSGLGLSIARGFARAIAGDVRLVSSARGERGARFEISLPLVAGERGL